MVCSIHFISSVWIEYVHYKNNDVIRFILPCKFLPVRCQLHAFFHLGTNKKSRHIHFHDKSYLHNYFNASLHGMLSSIQLHFLCFWWQHMDSLNETEAQLNVITLAPPASWPWPWCYVFRLSWCCWNAGVVLLTASGKQWTRNMK